MRKVVLTALAVLAFVAFTFSGCKKEPTPAKKAPTQTTPEKKPAAPPTPVAPEKQAAPAPAPAPGASTAPAPAPTTPPPTKAP